jgi:hypothetical protein
MGRLVDKTRGDEKNGKKFNYQLPLPNQKSKIGINPSS